jgi:phage antirepressor YoqD-like protein
MTDGPFTSAEARRWATMPEKRQELVALLDRALAAREQLQKERVNVLALIDPRIAYWDRLVDAMEKLLRETANEMLA